MTYERALRVRMNAGRWCAGDISRCAESAHLTKDEDDLRAGSLLRHTKKHTPKVSASLPYNLTTCARNLAFDRRAETALAKISEMC